MRHIIEDKAGEREHLHILPRADTCEFPLPTERRILGVKRKEHERLKAACLILQIAQGK